MTLRAWRQHSVLLACLVALLGAVTLAHAGPERRRSPGGFAVRHAEALGLDAEAQAQIEEIVAASETRDDALREELHAARHQMRTLLDTSSPPDEALVMAQADTIAAAEAEVHKNRLRAILDIRAVLTPEQREELVRLREARHGRKGHKRGIGPCRRDLAASCPDATDGKARLACLHEHWDTLSDRCRDVFEFAGRPPGPPPRP